MRYVPSTLNRKPHKTVWVVDDFYQDPHAVREFAMKQKFSENPQCHKGSRTEEQFFVPGTKEAFERIMGIKIEEWESHGMNGRFQYCTAEDPLVYHCDLQRWAAMIYLTPDAPYHTGTNLYAHKNRMRNSRQGDIDSCFTGGYYDSTKFDLVDSIGNVFNRLFLFDAQAIHAAAEYFGQTMTDSRLYHIFFFDDEKW